MSFSGAGSGRGVRPLIWLLLVLQGTAFAGADHLSLSTSPHTGSISYHYDLLALPSTSQSLLAHHLWETRAHYAPWPFIGVFLGGGLDYARILWGQDPVFSGTVSIAPSVGLSLSSPRLLADRVRAAAQAKVSLLSAQSRDDQSYRETRVEGDLGLYIAPVSFLEVGFGGSLNVVDGELKSASGSAVSYGVVDPLSIFAALGVQSEGNGVFMRTGVSIPVGALSDGPDAVDEISVRVAMGHTIRKRSQLDSKVERIDTRQDDIKRLKARIEQMEDELEERILP